MTERIVSVSESSPTNLEYLSRIIEASLSIPFSIRKPTAATYSSEPLDSLSRNILIASDMPLRSPISVYARMASRRTRV